MHNQFTRYENCRLCPKNCGADRIHGKTGFCGMPDTIKAASAVLHKGEEPPLIGLQGSGAVFFSGCTLGCPFCQNFQISRESIGAGLSGEDLVRIFMEFQKQGASNLNLVTATQFVPSIVSAVSDARAKGLGIPVMWNTSGYETTETIELLSDTVDIWLPDLKTLNTDLARRLFDAPDYPEAASAALLKMADYSDAAGGLLIQDDEMKRGMIVRHLVMPGETDSSREVLEWYSRNLKDRAMLSLMVQYTPVNAAGAVQPQDDYIMPEEEYDKLLDWLDEFEIEEGFLQSPEAASPEWIPDFSRINPFPDAYSRPVWHWRKGIIG